MAKTVEKQSKNKRIENFGKNLRKTGFQDKQPTGEAKSRGKKIAKFNREAIKQILNEPFNLSPEVRQQMIDKYGINPDDKSLGDLLTRYAAMKGFTEKGAGVQLKNLMAEAYGQPKQEIEHSGEIKSAPEIDLSKYTDDELRTLADLQSKGRISKT